MKNTIMIIDSVRRLIVKCLVWSDRVVLPNVFANSMAKLSRGSVFVDVDFFLFQTAEPALHHDIIGPALPPVHALRDVVFFQKGSVLVAGELTALVAVENCRSAVALNSLSLIHI